MGLICSKCGKKVNEEHTDLLKISVSGRYCYQCNTTFINKKHYNEHLSKCIKNPQ